MRIEDIKEFVDARPALTRIEVTTELGADVTYEEGPGAHEWDFWNCYIKKVLDWLPLDKDSKEGLNSGNVGL